MLTVVEAPLVDVQYKGSGVKAVEIEKLTHLARYLVKKREFVAHVHFVRSDKIEEFVQSLSKRAEYDGQYMSTLVGKSFEAIKTSTAVRQQLATALKPRLRWRLQMILQNHRMENDISSLALGYNEKKGLIIELDIDKEAIDALNADSEALKITREMLKSQARYEGEFIFEEEVPF